MNLGASVLLFREGLEGALIIAIMLGYLRKVGRLDRQASIWVGVLLAAAGATGFTLLLQFIGAQFEDPAQAIYEGVTSLLAVVMLTFMIVWMSRQARYIKGSLEQSMRSSFATGATWGLFGLAFLTVAREGVETALFLSATAFESSGRATILGAILGLSVAIVVALAVYVAGIRLNMRTFFKVTTILLVIFGAAIFRYAVHEFQDANLLPMIIPQVWNTSTWLPADSTLGSILQTLLGYTSNPSLSEVLAYVGFLVAVPVFLYVAGKRSTGPARPASVGTATSAPAQAAHVEESRPAEHVRS